MKPIYPLLAAGLLTFGAAVAQKSVMQAPAMARAQMPDQPARVINDTRELGTYMFAATSVDYQHERAFLNFYSEEPSKLNKMGYLWPVDHVDNLLYKMIAGTNTPDGYYGMMVRQFTIGDRVDGWIKVNTEDGSYEQVVNYKDAAYAWEGSHDYAYNYNNGKMYGVAWDSSTPGEGGGVTTMIGEVDPQTGRFTKLATTPEYIFCLAFDYDGNAYGISWVYDASVSEQPTGTYLVKFDSDWKFADKWLLQPEGKDFASYFTHTMEFDHSTGDLWWAGTNLDFRQSLFRINPDDHSIERKGSIGWFDLITGLHIPFETADHREAPARVSDLAFTPSEDGSNKVTLTWTNPSTQWNRQPLTQLGNIEIYRDNTMSPIAVVNGNPGEECSYTDANSPAGMHTYYVIPTNDKGLGVSDKINAFSGRDVPGVVQNIKSVALNGGKSVTVTWKAPVGGAHDGWFDNTSLTYNVTRMPDNVQVASGLTKTSYKDENIEVVERYTYVITPVTSDGEGTPATSPEVLAGTYVPVPYASDFESKTEANRWTAVDGNGDGKTFEYNDFTWPDVGRCWRHLLSASGNDDSLISPPFHLETGKTYKLNFMCHFHDLNQSYTFNFKAGQSMEDMTQFDSQEYITTDRNYDSRDVFTTYYTATSDEPTYLALNVVTGNTIDTFRFYGFSIEEEFENDMAVIGFEAPREIVNQSPATVTVNVHNNGSNTQSAYKIRIYADGNILLGETSDVKTLNARKAANHTFTIVPDVQLTGNVVLTARVVLDGDQNDSNDVSVPVDADLLAAGKSPINHTVEGMTPGLSSSIPMSHYYPYSLVQTIYPYSELRLQNQQGPLYIHRLGWEYTVEPNEDGTPNEVLGTNLRVGLGQTNVTTFPQSGASWDNNRLQVFSGRVSFLEGTHYLIVDLDSPFEIDPTGNLVVTVAKDNFESQGDWNPFFTIYGEDWKAPQFWHSLKALGNREMYGLNSSPNPTVVPEAAKLFLAINNNQSSVATVDFNEAVRYDSNLRAMRLLGLDARSMQVVDMTGRTVDFRTLSGEETIGIDLAPGFYVVTVKNTDGRKTVSKITVR